METPFWSASRMSSTPIRTNLCNRGQASKPGSCITWHTIHSAWLPGTVLATSKAFGCKCAYVNHSASVVKLIHYPCESLPGRLRVNGYVVRITSDSVSSPQTLRTVPQSHFEATVTAATLNLGHYVHNHITSIEHHLFQLRNHKTDIGNNTQSSSHPSDGHTTGNQPSSHCA